MNPNPDCFFFMRIKAPNGLSGTEDHLNRCELKLEPWKSGYNGKVILRNQSEERVEWEMDSSDTDTMVAHGCIFLTVNKASQLLQSLSKALAAAHFPHEIRIDDEDGNNRFSCSYMWE
jgi:hypothetical protein